MFHYTFKVKPEDVLGKTYLPPFSYRLVGENVPGIFVDNNATVDHFVFSAVAMGPDDITWVWPNAYDIEEDETLVRYPTTAEGWIKPIALFAGLPLKIRFYTLGEIDNALPDKIRSVGCGYGYEIWTGVFDNLQEFTDLHLPAFCVHIQPA